MRWIGLIALVLMLAGCGSADEAVTTDNPTPRSGPATLEPGSVLSRIAFGSCADEKRPQPIWSAVRAAKPDLFIFLGDNVYADTSDMAQLRAAYAKLAAVREFAALRKETPILATWDDHDYGRNDAGAEFEAKAASQEVFLDFFGEPADSQRRGTPGIYDARVIGPEGKRVQVILLDTRYFRGPLERWPEGERPRGQGPYIATEDTTRTMLGEAQWKWLEAQLEVPAELRIIASSIQFVADQHHWEKWANFPHERKRMLGLIERTGADGVVFISGDRHLGEISVMSGSAPYPIFDVTSSSLTHSLSPREEPNRHRVGGLVFAENFGLIEVDWSAADPSVTMQLRDETGATVATRRVQLSTLSSP